MNLLVPIEEFGLSCVQVMSCVMSGVFLDRGVECRNTKRGTRQEEGEKREERKEERGVRKEKERANHVTVSSQIRGLHNLLQIICVGQVLVPQSVCVFSSD